MEDNGGGGQPILLVEPQLPLLIAEPELLKKGKPMLQAASESVAKPAAEESKKCAEELKECAEKWYQCSLPKPPVPRLEHTMARYLEYAAVQAQTSGLDLEETRESVRQFQAEAGPKLQQELAELAEQEQNWINGFWLSEMYLRQRQPLPLNFNPAYIFPRKQFRSEHEQLDYAAWLVRGFLDFKQRVEKKQIAREWVPDRFALNGTTLPMCMDQYERILNFYRMPSAAEDRLIDRRKQENGISDNSSEDSSSPASLACMNEEHILVLSQCQPFVLFTRWRGRPLPAPILARHLASIRLMARNRGGGQAKALGAAGTGGREKAAHFWTEMSKDPANQCALDWAKSAVFVLCLDDEEDATAVTNANDAVKEGTFADGKLTEQERDGHRLLHGFGPAVNGLNRWFDATIQLIVSRSGCCGMCIEHSVAEGIVYINMTEAVIRFADGSWVGREKEEQEQENEIGTKNSKDLDAKVENKDCPLLAKEDAKEDADDANDADAVPEPSPLSWAISEQAATLLEEQAAEFDRLARTIQLRVLNFDGFGKTAIKGWHVSPDGFVQLCMQLAHFRLHGYLVSTYESATMRRFRLGRVDNIRAATPEALAWAKLMADPAQAKAQRRAAFREAAAKQALITRENVTGHGNDNHLCALEVLSRKLADEKRPRLFQERMWAELMRFPLTTSQVSTSPEFRGCYLCYGPVVKDGYGCAYNIQPDKLIFAISTWADDSRTSVEAFREKLSESLTAMRQMLEGEEEEEEEKEVKKNDNCT